MQRDFSALTSRKHDLLIVGGGIYGACLALEGALAGLRVAMVEKGDFGSGTSSNSLRIIHGGLRYLQHLDLRRMRESIAARRDWLRFAPHLLQPADFAVPTFGHGVRGFWTHAAALKITDLVGWDRNHGLRPESRIARGQMLSRSATAAILAPFRVDGCNGAACWQDVVCLDSERLLLEVLQQAWARGGRLANHAPATGLVIDRGRVAGAEVVDLETGRRHTVEAMHVVNATGPWMAGLLDSVSGAAHQRPLYSRAFNVLVRDLALRAAAGIPVVRRGRDLDAVVSKGTNTYFFVPWNGLTLVGTKHLPEYSDRPSGRLPESAVDSFLEEINEILRSERLGRADVMAVLSGWLPERGTGDSGQDPVLEKHTKIIEHDKRDGLPGITSVVGVKWTTARSVARRVLRLLSKKQAIRRLPPIPNHRAEPLEMSAGASPSPPAARALMEEFPGADTPLVPGSPLTGIDVIRAARDEMALHLDDFVWRRSRMWQGPQAAEPMLEACAYWLSTVHNWDAARLEAELRSTRESLRLRQAGL